MCIPILFVFSRILYAGKFKEGHITGPALYLGKLWIEKEPKDTFINMFVSTIILYNCHDDRCTEIPKR